MARDMVPVLRDVEVLVSTQFIWVLIKNLIDSLLEEIEKRVNMDCSLLKNRKLSLFMEFLKNLSETTLKKPAR